MKSDPSLTTEEPEVATDGLVAIPFSIPASFQFFEIDPITHPISVA